ncbi:MAG: ArsR family transcriptional regulator [Acidobacteria bacterium]|jgi:ArsR family transcriptional regulator|nr:ArsR family transcriptional regulator [Acidobacteriota bacterium]
MTIRSLPLAPAARPVDECVPSGRIVPLDEASAATLAHLFGVLADGVRLRLLSGLCEAEEPVCACDLVLPVDRSQPTVSHHLKVLSDAGLVRGDREGRWIHYRPTDLGYRLYDVVRAAESGWTRL